MRLSRTVFEILLFIFQTIKEVVTVTMPLWGTICRPKAGTSCSTHIPNSKCLRLPATKKWKATPNVKLFVLSHPLGDSEVTHRVHLWLDGKGVVNFLLAIIELFSLALTAAALLTEICRNRRLLKGWVTLSAIFFVDGDVARNPSMDR